MHPQNAVSPRRFLVPAVVFVSFLLVALLFCPPRLSYLLTCRDRGGGPTSVAPRPLLNDLPAETHADLTFLHEPQVQRVGEGEGAVGWSALGQSAWADVARDGARKVQLTVDLAEDKGQRIPDDFYGIFLEVVVETKGGRERAAKGWARERGWGQQ